MAKLGLVTAGIVAGVASVAAIVRGLLRLFLAFVAVKLMLEFPYNGIDIPEKVKS